MASPATPASTSGKPTGSGKSMSSRLLTMKFMQRGSASGTTSPMSSPSTSRTPQSGLDSPSAAKRSKLTPSLGNQSPGLSTPTSESRGDFQGSWNGAETKWQFAIRENDSSRDSSEPSFRVDVVPGQRFEDEYDATSPRTWKNEEGQGRQVFGKKRKYAPQESKETKKESNDEVDSDDDDDPSDSGDSEDSFEDRARKVVNAPDYGSANSRRGLSGRAPNANSKIQCHSCQEFGHKSNECPNKKKFNRYP